MIIACSHSPPPPATHAPRISKKRNLAEQSRRRAAWAGRAVQGQWGEQPGQEASRQAHAKQVTHAKGSAAQAQKQPEALRLPPQRTAKPLCISPTGSAPQRAVQRQRTKKRPANDAKQKRPKAAQHQLPAPSWGSSGSGERREERKKNYSRMRKRMRNKNS